MSFKFTNRRWRRANVLKDKLEEMDFGIVERPSNCVPGIPYNTPVKIITVDLNESTIWPGQPYLSVYVKMPNGEFRTISGEAICEGKNAKRKFLSHKRIFDKGTK